MGHEMHVILIVWTTSIRCAIGLEILTKRVVWETRSEGMGKELADERTKCGAAECDYSKARFDCRCNASSRSMD